MKRESIEKNKEKPFPRTSERDVWRDFYKYVHSGDTDKILDLAVFLKEEGREEDAEAVLEKAYKIEGQNFREKAKEVLEGFEENKNREPEKLDK